jgi:hypothetical protein
MSLIIFAQRLFVVVVFLLSLFYLTFAKNSQRLFTFSLTFSR